MVWKTVAHCVGVAVMVVSSMRMVHWSVPWLVLAYGRTCFCPDVAMHRTHSPCGGCISVSITGRVLPLLVWQMPLVWMGAFSALSGSWRPGAHIHVHIRGLSLPFPEQHQSAACPTRPLWLAHSERSVKFSPRARFASAVMGVCSPVMQQCAGWGLRSFPFAPIIGGFPAVCQMRVCAAVIFVL